MVRERGLVHGGSAAEGGGIPLSEEEQLAKVGAELAASKERYAQRVHCWLLGCILLKMPAICIVATTRLRV